MTRIIFILPFLFSGLIYCQTNKIYILSDTINPKILKELINEKYNRFTPSAQEVGLADSLARIFIESLKKEKNSRYLVKDYNEYNRQFIGYIDKKGNRKIYMTSAYGNFCRKYDCLKKLINVLDGGDSFFQLKVNLTEKKCYGFMINGVG